MAFLKDIFNYSISSWANLIIGLASVTLTTRLLCPETYGQISIFYSVSNVFLYILTIGMDGALIRFFNEPPEGNTQSQLIYKSILTNIIIWICSFILLYIFFGEDISFFIYNNNGKILFSITMIYVLCQIILRYLNISFRMSFQVKKYTYQNILINSASRFFVIIAAFFTNNAEDILIVLTIGMAIILIFYIYSQKKEIIPVDKDNKYNFSLSYKNFKPYFKFSLFNAPTYIVVYLNTYLSQQVIINQISAFALGIYAATNMFSSILLVLKGGFSTYWSAYVYKNYHQNQSRISTMHDYIVFISSIFASLLIYFRDVIYLFIGPQFHDSKQFYSLLLIMPILYFILETTNKGISIKNKNYLSLLCYSISVAINLLGSIILAKTFGLHGIAWANAISSIVLYFLTTYYSQRYYKSIISSKRSIAGIITIIIMLIIPTIVTSFAIICIATFSLNLLSAYIYRKQLKTIYTYIYQYKNKKYQ